MQITFLSGEWHTVGHLGINQQFLLYPHLKKMPFCLLQGELGKQTIFLNLWVVFFSPRGRHNHMLMKNISTCKRGIRMRAISHQQAQVNHLATKGLFKPQQREKEQDFSL